MSFTSIATLPYLHHHKGTVLVEISHFLGTGSPGRQAEEEDDVDEDEEEDAGQSGGGGGGPGYAHLVGRRVLRLFEEGDGQGIYSGTVTAFLPADHEDPDDEGDCLEVRFDDARDAETTEQVYRVDDVLVDLLPADTPDRKRGQVYGTTYWYEMKARYDLLRRSLEAGTFSGTHQPTVRAAFGLSQGEDYDAPALTRVLCTLMRQLHPDKLQQTGNPLRARHLAKLFSAGLRYLREDLEYEQQGRASQFEPTVNAPTLTDWPAYSSAEFAAAAGAETEASTQPDQTPGLRRGAGPGAGGGDAGDAWAGDESEGWCPEGRPGGE